MNAQRWQFETYVGARWEGLSNIMVSLEVVRWKFKCSVVSLGSDDFPTNTSTDLMQIPRERWRWHKFKGQFKKHGINISHKNLSSLQDFSRVISPQRIADPSECIYQGFMKEAFDQPNDQSSSDQLPPSYIIQWPFPGIVKKIPIKGNSSAKLPLGQENGSGDENFPPFTYTTIRHPINQG